MTRAFRLRACAVALPILGMPYCALQMPDGPRWVDRSQEATYRVFAAPEQVHIDATVYVVAEIPESWTFMGSSYTGTVAGAPIAGTGTLLPGDPGICVDDMGPIQPGYHRVFLTEGPFPLLDPAEGDHALVELLVRTGTVDGTYQLRTWVNALDSGGEQCDDGSPLPVLLSENPEWQELVGGVVPVGFGQWLRHIDDVVEHDGAVFAATAGSDGQIWRSVDRLSWEQVFTWGDGWQTGLLNAPRFCDSAALNGHLLVGLSDGEYNPVGVGCRIWRSADGLSWEQSFVEPAPCRLDALFAYNDRVYAVVGIEYYPLRLWWTDDGVTWQAAAEFPAGTARVRSTQVFDGSMYFAGDYGADGICRFDGSSIESVAGHGCNAGYALTQFRDRLYAGCWGEGGAEIWSTSDGESWQEVAAFCAEYGDAVTGLAAHHNQLIAWTACSSEPGVMLSTLDLEQWRVSPLSSELTGEALTDLDDVASELFAAFSGQLWRWRPVFADGFESGDLSAWSQSVP